MICNFVFPGHVCLFSQSARTASLNSGGILQERCPVNSLLLDFFYRSHDVIDQD